MGSIAIWRVGWCSTAGCKHRELVLANILGSVYGVSTWRRLPEQVKSSWLITLAAQRKMTTHFVLFAVLPSISGGVRLSLCPLSYCREPNSSWLWIFLYALWSWQAGLTMACGMYQMAPLAFEMRFCVVLFCKSPSHPSLCTFWTFITAVACA